MDVINCADFYVDQFRGIDFVGVKFANSVCIFLELKIAVNTVMLN